MKKKLLCLILIMALVFSSSATMVNASTSSDANSVREVPNVEFNIDEHFSDIKIEAGYAGATIKNPEPEQEYIGLSCHILGIDNEGRTFLNNCFASHWYSIAYRLKNTENWTIIALESIGGGSIDAKEMQNGIYEIKARLAWRDLSDDSFRYSKWSTIQEFEKGNSTTRSIIHSNVTLSQNKYPYTGNACEPIVSVYELKEGKDYSIAYEDNVQPGIAKVILTGKGAHHGTQTIYFAILAPGETDVKDTYVRLACVTDKEPEFSVGVPKIHSVKTTPYGTFQVKWGKAKTHIVRYNGQDLWYTSDDYAMDYQFAYKKFSSSKWIYGQEWDFEKTVSGCEPATKYQFKVRAFVPKEAGANAPKAFGKWSNVETIVTNPAQVIIKDVSSKKKSVIIKWKAATKVDGYQVAYKKAGWKNYKKIYVKGTSKTIKKLSKNTKYTVKVRAYKKLDNGNKKYGVWSKVKTIRTK